MRNIIRITLAAIAFVITFFAFSVYLDSIFIRRLNVDLTSYFQPGDKLVSRFEGFDQTVLAVNEGWVHTRLEVAPKAGGPPEHMHRHFTETFTVKKGTLSILINGERRVLNAGETISIPPMTAHKPFNETNETVVVESEDPTTLPVKFAYHLTQMYGFMDRYADGPPLPRMLMQLSVYGDEFDSLMVGPPVSVQQAMRTMIAPTARLVGFSTHYPEFTPERHRSSLEPMATK